jgi:ribonuclease HII
VKDNPQKGAIEHTLIEEGYTLAGLDEVGRGCLAGPVVAACVVLDYQKLFALDHRTLSKIRDSKTLSAKQRAELIEIIQTISMDISLGTAEPRDIESIGILNATFLAMNRAVSSLQKVKPNLLLVDGNQRIRDQPIDQRTIVKGDSLCFAIAAASIIAKEHRDAYMRRCSVDLPHWGFEKHVGYGTADHLAAIKSHGICDLHRKNFTPIRNIL